MRNNKVNNWSQIHSIIPHNEFEHIKGKEDILADSLSRLKTLGLYENNGPEKPGHEYGESIFNFNLETACNVDTSHNANQGFEIDSVKYELDEEDLDDLSYKIQPHT